LEEQALDLLDAAYRKAEHREIEGKDALVFQDSDAANAVGLSTAARDTPRRVPNRRVMESLLDSGAVAVPLIRDRGLSGSTFYEITTHGVEMLHEAGRIA
jgi:hypothetical protein